MAETMELLAARIAMGAVAVQSGEPEAIIIIGMLRGELRYMGNEAVPAEQLGSTAAGDGEPACAARPCRLPDNAPPCIGCSCRASSFEARAQRMLSDLSPVDGLNPAIGDDMVGRADAAYFEHVTGYSLRDGGQAHTCRCGEEWTGPAAASEARAHRMRLALEAALTVTARAVEDEFAPGECQGHGACDAPLHVHGCFADDGDCDAPGEHETTEERSES